MKRTVATRSVGRGLGRIEPDGGVLVAYAAKHGPRSWMNARQERDHWRDQAQRLALPKPIEPEQPTWWRWLRSKVLPP